MKDMEVGEKVMGLFDRYVGNEKVKVNGSKGWRIVNQFVKIREKSRHRHLSCATVQSRLSLYVLRKPCECNLHLELIPHSCKFECARCSAPTSSKKADQHPTTHGQERSILRSSIGRCTWWNMHRRATGWRRGK